MSLPAPIPPKERRGLAVPPQLLRAAVSPSAIVTTAAGAGIGALDHSIVLTIVLAVVGWTGRMTAAVVAKRRRDRAARPHPAELDPWSVPEPWRQLVRQAADAQTRFDRIVNDWPPGPTKDRLEQMRPRVYDEVADLGLLARQGAAAEGWTGATGAGSTGAAPSQLGAELERLRAERARLGATAPRRLVEITRREEAVAAQLRSLRQSQAVSAELQDQLRLAVARLAQTVTDLITIDPGDSSEPAGMHRALDELSDGISTLRAALTETAGSPPTETGTP